MVKEYAALVADQIIAGGSRYVEGNHGDQENNEILEVFIFLSV